MGTVLNMLIYGYGGHGRVIADCLQDAGIAIAGVFDDNPVIDVPYPFAGNYAPDFYPEVPLILAIGDNKIRKALAEKVSHRSGTVMHASVQLSRHARIGAGSMLMHRAILQTAVEVGRHCIINSGAIIEHESRIEDYVHIAPGAILCGNVVVGEGSLVGAGAVILPGIQLGKGCIIGAGAVVAAAVPDGQRWAGNPARPLST